MNVLLAAADPGAAGATGAPAVPDVKKAAEELATRPVETVSKWAEATGNFAINHGPSVVGALVLFFVAWVLARWVRRMVIKGFTRAHVDLTLAKFFGNLAKWSILIFAVITCAGTIGLPITGFAALIGAAGLAIGLALQGNLGNLASGVLLMIFRPFKIGDSVIVAGQAGVVDGIDLFSTNLDTGDNRRIIVPNGAIFSGVIENQTHHPYRRVSVNVPVSGAADPETARSAFAAAANRVIASTAGALPEPAPGVAMTELAPTQTWAVAVSAQTPRFGAVREALLLEIRRTVLEHKLNPPGPTMDVRITAMPEGR
ncbi:MAG: mechanosensitive ion channel family protein [Phycisphaerales bacterium]|nr:mechanosensitive ion channel family protein [Phycisphaerales bacterium]